MTNSINYTTHNNDNFNDKPLIITSIVICLIVILLSFIYMWYDNTHYSNVCYVDNVTDTEILMTDSCGDIWAVDTIKGIKEDDLVSVYFYNNGTTYTHADDIITYVKIMREE